MQFSTRFLSYKELPFFSNIVKDYIADTEIVKPLRTYASKENIVRVIEGRDAFPFFRSEISHILSNQYAAKSVACCHEVHANIERLKDSNTYTVCTAHQPHIAFGPLYILYKAIQVVEMALLLSKTYPAYRFVPVFFIGSEDADKGELLQLSVMSKMHRYHTTEKGSVGRICTDGTASFLQSLYARVKHLPYAEGAFQLLESAYQFPTFSLAFRHILHCLFGEKGLVVLDIDDVAVKRLALPLIKKDIWESFSQTIVEKTTQYIDTHYGWHQLNANAVNLFLMEKQMRKKVQKIGNAFKLPHSERLYSVREYVDYCEANPETISPGAVLRPLVQELILPNIIIVGGGAEIAYWLQLKKAFEEASIHFPLLQLRHSHQLIPPNDRYVLEQQGIPPLSLFDYYPLPMERISKGEKHLQTSLQYKAALMQSADKYFKSLMSSAYLHYSQLAATQKNMLSIIDKIENKFIQKVHRQENIPVLYDIFQRLFPSGGLQERTDSFFEWYASYGDEWISLLQQHCHDIQHDHFSLCAMISE